MFARWLPVTLLGALGLLAGSARAQDEESEPPLAEPAAACSTECCPPPCDITIHHTNIVLAPTQEAICVPQLNIREVVTKVPATTVAVEFKEEKRCVTVTVAKPREVERVVESVSWIPETTTDSCGHCCTTLKPVKQCKTVKVTVYDHVCETKEVTVKVPVIKEVPIEYQVKQLTADWTSQAALQTKLDAVVVPVEIKVPNVCCPIPPPPCSPPKPCCGGCGH